MAQLFKVLAGTSEDTFNIGKVSFQAAPLTIMEYAEYLALPEGFDAKCEYYAAKLRSRQQGTKDPVAITAEWVMENLPVSMIPVLEHVLIHGKMPDPSEKKAAP